MRADQAPQGEGERRRTTTGPRHAAPRRSVLGRLQMPAGKAIALAAMPTAVLMGMGFTPQLAQADPQPKDRFRPGPCVTRPDEPSPDEEKDGKAGRKDGADRGATPGGGESAGPGEPSSPPSGPGPSETAPPPGSDPGDDTPPEPPADEPSAPEEPGGEPTAPAPEPSPSESDKRNPLDPLGLGDAVGDLLGIGGDDESDGEPSDAPAPEPSESSPAPAGTASGSSGSAAEDTAAPAEETARDTADRAGEAAAPAGGTAGGTARETAGKTEGTEGAAPSPSPSAPRGEDGGAGEGEDAGEAEGKEPFPCPTYDAEALADAEEEKTSSLLPDDPWILKSSKLSLHGLDYKGVVKVRTHSGRLKNVLKFTAESVDIRDLHQLVKGPGGTTLHAEAAEGSNSTIRNGTVTLYTEELKGNLFGLIPVTFGPKSPPPLNLPEVFFTDVTIRQAGQFGGTLRIPGLHSYGTPG